MHELVNIRSADVTNDEINMILKLLFDHGPNEWNFIPKAGVAKEFEDLRNGKAIAVIAECGNEIIGFAFAYPFLNRFPEIAGTIDPAIAYIGDVVVNVSYVGKGVGSRLLNECKIQLSSLGITQVILDCHEENLASRGMIRKSGLEQLLIFYDPERRTAGSRRSCVSVWNYTSTILPFK